MTDGIDTPPPGGVGETRAMRSLACARAVTDELSDELLSHVPDIGDLGAQRVLDGWVEQAADTLRALSQAMEERLLDLAGGASTPSSRVVGAPDAERSRG